MNVQTSLDLQQEGYGSATAATLSITVSNPADYLFSCINSPPFLRHETILINMNKCDMINNKVMNVFFTFAVK